MLDNQRNSPSQSEPPTEQSLRFHLSKQRGTPFSDQEWVRAKHGMLLLDYSQDHNNPKRYKISKKYANETNQPMPLNNATMFGPGPSKSRSKKTTPHNTKMEFIYYFAIAAILFCSNTLLPPEMAALASTGFILGLIGIAGIYCFRLIRNS
ncbi:MAG: hypothetical protein AAGA18_03790 [Verrucomicrobiota bacterium]